MTLLYRPRRHTLLAAGVTDPPPVDPPPPPSGMVDGLTRHGANAVQVFNPASYLNVPLPDNVAIDTRSAAAAAALASQAAAALKPTFGTTRFSSRVVRMPPGYRRVPVRIMKNTWGGVVPQWAYGMQEVLLDPGVMIPEDYVPQGDSDNSLCIYMPDLNMSEEYWRLEPIDPAQFGGIAWQCQAFWRHTNLATHPGRSRNNTQGAVYPHAPSTAAKRAIFEDTSMSLSASRIPVIATLITVEDVLRGAVDHCVSLSTLYSRQDVFTSTDPNKGYQWPASSSDGFTANYAVRQGDRYRFAHDFVIPTNVHPLCQLAMQATRDYGMLVTDKAGSLEIDAEQGVSIFLNGTAPFQVLDGFRWDLLQLVKAGNDSNPNPTS